jgi:putative glutamine amidotransferase
MDNLPLIGIPACLMADEGFGFHPVGDKYVMAVLDGAGGLPLLIPALGPRLERAALLPRLDGLLITGARSNVEPHHYGALLPAAPASDLADFRDPARDATVLPLIREAIAAGVPLLAICRGIQELNVAQGGTLHQEVHALPGRLDHRSDKSVPHQERYRDVHPVALTQGGKLQELLGGATEIRVNSLHGQAIDRLAPGLVVEAVAADGTIEAVIVAGAAAFALAVQWHPEWRVLDNPVSRALFAAFGAACRARQAARNAGTTRLATGGLDEHHGAMAARA